MGMFDKFSKRKKGLDRIVEITNTFMNAAMLLLLPQDMNVEQGRKIMAFELGVIDFLSQSEGFGQEGTVKAATMYLKKYREMPVNERSVLNIGVQIGQDPDLKECWTIGGNAIKTWVKDRNENAPLELAKLMSSREIRERAWNSLTDTEKNLSRDK